MLFFISYNWYFLTYRYILYCVFRINHTVWGYCAYIIFVTITKPCCIIVYIIPDSLYKRICSWYDTRVWIWVRNTAQIICTQYFFTWKNSQTINIFKNRNTIIVVIHTIATNQMFLIIVNRSCRAFWYILVFYIYNITVI